MNVNRCIKESFTIIGKEGSTLDGQGFVQRLWEDANSHFAEIQHLAKKDENGGLAGIWGAMSDFSGGLDEMGHSRLRISLRGVRRWGYLPGNAALAGGEPPLPGRGRT